MPIHDSKGLRLKGKTVLVTGAGGSIGAEICRQLRGNKLILFEQSEYALYKIHAELGGVPILGSCADEPLVKHVFARYRPDLVIHAAAYKHVPMLEGENAFAGVRNNVLGTLYTARHAPGRYVLVSTDKAVNPSCVMGASKRLCELVAAELGGAIVRFGNVLDSAGSVVPRFREQIAAGGPLTVTHPDVERYFMTIPQAAGLVLAAADLGGRGLVYVLEMGAPRKIIDLAREMLAAADANLEIRFIGLRQGEKITEELKRSDERKIPTTNPAIYALHGTMEKVCHRLSFLDRGYATSRETRGFLDGILTESAPHLADRHLSIVET